MLSNKLSDLTFGPGMSSGSQKRVLAVIRVPRESWRILAILSPEQGSLTLGLDFTIGSTLKVHCSLLTPLKSPGSQLTPVGLQGVALARIASHFEHATRVS